MREKEMTVERVEKANQAARLYDTPGRCPGKSVRHHKSFNQSGFRLTRSETTVAVRSTWHVK